MMAAMAGVGLVGALFILMWPGHETTRPGASQPSAGAP